MTTPRHHSQGSRCRGLYPVCLSGLLSIMASCSAVDAQESSRTMHTLGISGPYSQVLVRGATETADGTDVQKQMLIRFTGDLSLDKEGKIMGDIGAIRLEGYAFSNDAPFTPFGSATIEDGKLLLGLQQGRNIYLQGTVHHNDPTPMPRTGRPRSRATIELPKDSEKYVQQVGDAHIIVSFGDAGFVGTVVGDHRNYTLKNKTHRRLSLALVRDSNNKYWGTEDSSSDVIVFDAERKVEKGTLERRQESQ